MADPHTTMKAVVVDADQNSLLSLQKVLEECNYIVTTCEDSEQFLSMIREEQTKFQLVIIEVSVTPTNGYELCRLLRKNTNIPIIMTSSTDSKTETAEMVKKALHNGASDFLLKPIKLEDLGKINLDMTHKPNLDMTHKNLIKPLIKQEWSHGDQEQDISATNTTTTYSVQDGSLGKHKEELAVTTLEQPARKKRRVVWTQELHDVFVKAVNQLGTEKANPKKIMEVMNIDGLTRENVASHLQKYRQHLMKQQGGAQEKKPRRRQLHQQCEQNIVKPEQDVNQTLMSVPSSSISHQTETDDPIINSEQQVQATNVGSHQLVHNWPHTSVQEVGLLQESSSYEKLRAALLQRFHWGQQLQQLQQPSLYEQNLNPTLLMYDPNPYPAHLFYDSNPSSAQLVYAQNTNPAHYMDQMVYVDSSDMGLATDFPTEIPQHEPGLPDFPSVIISGLPITPRIEIKSGNLKACPADHSLINPCPLYHDQHQLNEFYYDIEHNLHLNPVVNGGDDQGGELANQNDQINPQDIVADADAFDLKDFLQDI